MLGVVRAPKETFLSGCEVESLLVNDKWEMKECDDLAKSYSFMAQ